MICFNLFPKMILSKFCSVQHNVHIFLLTLISVGWLLLVVKYVSRINEHYDLISQMMYLIFSCVFVKQCD